ncbi:hypothetical protein [Actinoplanes sp. RD1]|uniref:hypothetical protein n=1 Tax=Actinoplanes sp. RD1 TaxID=3064538 RepID=UPI0027404DD8|nr:hypothetical protein [Actinoplanes sp. RD1]
MGELTKRDKQILGGSVAVLVAAGAGALVLGDSGGSPAVPGAAGLGRRPVIADARLGPAREPDAALNIVPVSRQPAPAPGAPSTAPETAGPFTPDAIDPSTIWTLTPAGPVRSTTRPATRRPVVPVRTAPGVPVIPATMPPVLTPPVPTPVRTSPEPPPVVTLPPVVTPPPPREEPEPVETPTWEEPEPVETDDWEEPAARDEPDERWDEAVEPHFFPWESGEGGLPDADTFDWESDRLDGIDDID